LAKIAENHNIDPRLVEFPATCDVLSESLDAVDAGRARVARYLRQERIRVVVVLAEAAEKLELIEQGNKKCPSFGSHQTSKGYKR
jgi:hypothetical protein